MNKILKKFLSIGLCIMMLVGMIPIVCLPAEAATLTSASFIANTEHREYIDMMMEYHLSTNPTLQSTLANGKSVIFMFEGGSDNYPGNGYSESSSNQRNQAVCIVVKQVNGVNQIVFYNENSSSLPAQPSYCEGDQQTAILDGIYSVYTWNHQGRYGALQINVNQGLYTPAANRNGVIKSASGINIHTRMNLESGSPSSAWSWGCQLIGYGNTSGNAFNEFMKCVANINFNVWTSWSPKSYTKLSSTGSTVGYYVLDRQLAKDGMTSIYNNNAIATLTAASQASREAAEELYGMPIQESYPTHGNVTVKKNGIKIMNMPCDATLNANAERLEATLTSVYEAIGLCLNDNGELWYKVKLKTKNGEGYLYAGDTTAFEPIDDITISGVTVPETLNHGSATSLNGTVSTEYTVLSSVGAIVDQVGGSTNVTGYMVGGINQKYVNLRETEFTIRGQKQPLDHTVEYDTLAVGNYILKVSAMAKMYWAETPTQVKQISSSKTEVKHFSIVDGSCNHAYSAQVTDPGCETEGYTTNTCSGCNSSYLSNFLPPLEHSYADATCTAPQTCTTCGATTGTPKVLASIAVTTVPTKLTYGANEELSVAGGKVTLYAEDGTSEVIDLTADIVAGFDSTVAGKQTLTVTYMEKTATYEVEVIVPTSETNPAETLDPETDVADTEAVTDEGGEEMPADTTPLTDENGDPVEPDANDPSEGADTGNDPIAWPKVNGCGSVLSGASILLIAAAGVALINRKREE